MRIQFKFRILGFLITSIHYEAIKWSIAGKSLPYIDNVSLYVPKECSKYGAYQNALEHILNNVRTTKENLTSAQSKIRDTNIIYFTP